MTNHDMNVYIFAYLTNFNYLIYNFDIFSLVLHNSCQEKNYNDVYSSVSSLKNRFKLFPFALSSLVILIMYITVEERNTTQYNTI